MVIEQTLNGTWIAHGYANGVPYVAEGKTRHDAFVDAVEAIFAGAARRKLRELSGGRHE